jgi:hypothetical protein
MKKGMTSAADFMSNANSNGAPFINEEGQLQQNAGTTLLEDEHRRIDAAVLQQSRIHMSATEDLRRHTLTTSLGGIGVLLSGYNRVGDMTDANVDFDGRTRGDKDRLTFDQVEVPIPIFHKEWELGARQLASSRGGSNLDTSQSEIATRIVAERFEKSIFDGEPTLKLAGQSLYGYTTHPDRNTHTLVADWTDPTAGTAMVTDLLAMVGIQRADNQRGQYMVYVADDIWSGSMQADYSAAKGDNQVLDRLETIREIDKIAPSAFLASGTVVMVQMTRETVDLAIAADLQNIQWNVQPFSTEYMVYMMGAVRVKSEKNGQCGVLHAT